ncbi:MAG: YHYH domain-containing protein [Variovorax paradoxus]|uniref:YHYH domain-containing protein n=1 Tax=Variovorax paradoxus TaxID=34073 RepID=A0A2W5QKK4_VARPD|nr:MAG: YHYH domain-containing protein [Variovorax paradoxus]
MRTVVFVALVATAPAWAQAPAILLEACSAMGPASKRQDCLRAANGATSGGSTRTAPAPQALYSPTTATPRAAMPSMSAPSGSSYSVGGRTCYVGPRGGTYTITASGRKNYSGC